MKTNAITRLEWLDYGKGIGIFLVVFSHVLSNTYHAEHGLPQPFFDLCDSVIYSFHIPLFFLLSGLLVERSLRKRGAREFLREKFVRLAIPYFVWSLLQVGAELAFRAHAEHPIALADLLSIPYQPREQFWFLYALMWTYLGFAGLRLLNAPFPAMLAAALLLFFVPIRTDVMSLADFSIEFLFLIIGVGLARKLDLRVMLRLPVGLVCALAISFVCAALFVFSSLIEPTRLINGYGDHPIYFLLLANWGIAASIAVAHYLARTNKLKLLNTFGRYSMPIFVSHMLIAVPVRIVLTHEGVTNAAVQVMVAVTAAMFVPILLFRVSERLKLTYLLPT